MNNLPVNLAPAALALWASAAARPVDGILVALAAFLATVLGPVAAAPFLAAVLHALRHGRACAATPAQRRRALRRLHTLHSAHALPLRPHPFRPARAARRRIAVCWRMLVNPPHRRARFPRPAAARNRGAAGSRPTFRQRPHARAGPATLFHALFEVLRSHVIFVTI